MIIGTDMQEVYLRLIDDKEFEIRMIVVQSLHEIFKLMQQDEDMTKIRDCFKLILSSKRDEPGSPENSLFLDLIS